MVKKVPAVEVRNIEIRVAVVVVVAGDDPFGEGDLINARCLRNVLKGPVAFVQKELACPFSLPTNKSSRPSLLMSVHTAVCVRVAGSASPASRVTSVNVPSQLFRNNDLRTGISHAPRSTRMSMHPSLL